MKKMGMVCMTVLCLTTQNLSARMVTELDFYMEMSSEQDIERIREEFKDAAKVRKAFDEGDLLFFGTSKQIVEFKRKFGVSDEPMLTVVMEIIHEELVKKAELKEGPYFGMRLWRTLRWLGVCADTKTKQFLLDIATDRANGYNTCVYAIEAYMHRADAQEVRSVIVRFSGDDMRVRGKDGSPPVYQCVYEYAIQAYDEAEGDTPKREAIITMMSTLLAKEESKTIFVGVDKALAERSREYAESPQRKAALERMNKPPDPKTP